MKIVIVGGGLAGLATTWNVLETFPKADVCVLDREGIGAGASGVAAGLIHPYGGYCARKSPYGDEGMHSTEELLHIVGNGIIISKGIVRPAMDEKQLIHFRKCADEYEEVEWRDPAGIFIPQGLSIDCNTYLTRLWQACENKGAHFEKRSLQDTRELDDFDIVILCLGNAVPSFPLWDSLKLGSLKGQIIELEWPEGKPPLEHALIGRSYITMSPGRNSCIVGSTFEREVHNDVHFAETFLRPRAEELIPDLKSARLLDTRSGVRVTRPDHLPLIGTFDNRIFYFTALGSKGLLYHALYAKKLITLLRQVFSSTHSSAQNNQTSH